MKKFSCTALKILVLCAIVTAIAGCEEELSSDTRKSKLFAAENIQLKKDIQKYNKNIEIRDQQIKKQKGLIEKYQLKEEERKGADIKALSKAKMDKTMSAMARQSGKVNLRLAKENRRLKEQIAALQKELENLKNPQTP